MEAVPDQSGDQSGETGLYKVAESQQATCLELVCPRCKAIVMEYNGLLELICPLCGYKETGGAFT